MKEIAERSDASGNFLDAFPLDPGRIHHGGGAAGGISSFDDAEKFISLGASRLGTSRIVKLAKNENAQGY